MCVSEVLTWSSSPPPLPVTSCRQSLFGRHAVLAALGLRPKSARATVLDSGFPEFEPTFKAMWADNADVLSNLYSGTGALKTDFTRWVWGTGRGGGMEAVWREVYIWLGMGQWGSVGWMVSLFWHSPFVSTCQEYLLPLVRVAWCVCVWMYVWMCVCVWGGGVLFFWYQDGQEDPRWCAAGWLELHLRE